MFPCFGDATDDDHRMCNDWGLFCLSILIAIAALMAALGAMGLLVTLLFVACWRAAGASRDNECKGSPTSSPLGVRNWDINASYL